MSITRDQLRAARALLHLKQQQLASLSQVSLSTIRRFEGGLEIGPLYSDALRRSLVEAGALFIDEDSTDGIPTGAVGVVLKPAPKLPEATRLRIAADAAIPATDSLSAIGGSPETGPSDPSPSETGGGSENGEA
ncbi:helix-turn-helix transcriptional regulator [Lichenibacterium dinghuense]|uniref:helix-turn-helix transcriptional regulator n=1 Tax=Lichenibacterium dinghuense TaxID=2895977 RepID=UPI001F24F9DD|nr:helix-turn-helix transcriptional regulator [Lichenibacterium sp. 6Y81]